MTWRSRLQQRVARKLTQIDKRIIGITDIDLVAVDRKTDLAETVYTIHGGWFFEKTETQPTSYDDIARRGNYLLSVADNSDEMTEAISGDGSKATHVQIGDVRYVINRPDATPPAIDDPLWKIPCYHKFV